jgi:DNA (cytosine-5)-methyltransferase 1
MTSHPEPAQFVDLFAGIGGFRIAAEALGWRCVFSSETDRECRRVYSANFGDVPSGDIRSIDANVVPDHDVLMAGFPCQPFSIIGKMNGMRDTRGTLYFEIERIVRSKLPRWVVLENVKQLISNDRGRTLQTICDSLRVDGYEVTWAVLNALDFGLPQKRERVFIVANRSGGLFDWDRLRESAMRPLKDILEPAVDAKYFVSDQIREKRFLKHSSSVSPSVWHENKGGNISSYSYSCALRANASYNYLLVDGIRRLTPREMLRLQGFPEEFQIVTSDAQIRKQAGNAVAVPVARAVLEQIDALERRMEHDNPAHKASTPLQPAISAR